MAVMNENILYGSSVEQGQYAASGGAPRLFFRDQANGRMFAVDEASVFRHILLIGGSGSGKTNVLNQVVAQTLRWTAAAPRDGVSLIFDTKGDYLSHAGFFKPGDYMIGNDSAHRDRSDVWNIFEEILADGSDPVDYEANAREIANVLFKDRGSKTQPFFADAARDIFANMLIYFVRRRRDDPSFWGDKLNNADFITFLRRSKASQFVKCFQLYADMRSLLSYIGDGTSNQALGVFGELNSMLNDCFQGVFCKKAAPGRKPFSIRRAIREKGGRTIFILYDLAIGETLIPMYRLLIDLALKEALSNTSSGHTHLFLDELKLAPKMTHLEDAINYGRGKHVSVVAGLQSVGQIYSIYGREAGQVILGGFGSVIALNTRDWESREYVTRLFGPNITAYRYENGSRSPIDRERDGNTVEHWHVQRLAPGHAIVSLASQTDPFFFYFEKDKG